MDQRGSAATALAASTIAFALCFASWVINSVLVSYFLANEIFALTEARVGWLLAAPVLTGALTRVPLGIVTDRYGARLVFTALLMASAAALWLLSICQTYAEYLLTSFVFGIAGGAFAVGVAHVAGWFAKERQGTALGIFGVGNIGAAATTIIAPRLLVMLTAGGPDGWRGLPRIYAAVLAAAAVLFWLTARDATVKNATVRTWSSSIRPLRDRVVWRFGLYYFLLFGAFVAMAQWIVPYTLNVYSMTLAQAGLLAAVFSFPSGAIRAVGGFLSDRFGARTVMYQVFGGTLAVCLFLSIPRMRLEAPGEGVMTAVAGSVVSVSPSRIVTTSRAYELQPPPAQANDAGSSDPMGPRITRWHVPAVRPGQNVQRKQMVASGVTGIFYPANIALFIAALAIFGTLTGIGSAGVYKFIPEQFPRNVGAVGGMVGLLGALGGFVFPTLFGYMLRVSGLWTSCWLLLAFMSVVCMIVLHHSVRRMIQDQAPQIAQALDVPTLELALGPADLETPPNMLPFTLRTVQWFGDLRHEDVQNLMETATYPRFEPGSTIYQEGDAADAMYIIVDGNVRLIRGSGREAVDLALLGSGDFFGEVELIDGGLRATSALAASAVEVLPIARSQFFKLVSKSPRMLADILFGFSTKTRQYNQRLFDSILHQERMKLEQELERHRSLGEVVAGVAHEINTPIGIVNHAASIIAEQLRSETASRMAGDDDARELMQDLTDASMLIQSNIARADALIRNFKHIAAGQIADNKETLDFRKLTRDVLDLFRLRAKSADWDLAVIDQLPPGEAMWEGYPGHYTQVLMNLLTNVERYAYPGAAARRVEVVLSQDDEARTYEVLVRDFGQGMSKETLARAFEPFFTTGRATGGTGLGLPIVQNLVTNSLRGTIRVESEPGQGTAVYVAIPRAIRDAAASTGD